MDIPQPPAKKPRKPRLKAPRPTVTQRRRAKPLEDVPLGIQALLLLDNFGCLTGAQLSRLLFFGRASKHHRPRQLEGANKAANEVCLAPLKEAGLVQVIGYPKYHFNATIDEHPFGQHELNLLTALGARRLEQHYAAHGLRYERRYTTRLRHDLLRATPHDLEIVNAGALLSGHAGMEGWELVRWQTDRQLRGARASGATLLGNLEPDAYLVLRKENVDVPFFLEIDRETEPPDGDAPNSWKTKISKYGVYLRDHYAYDAYFPYLPHRPRVLTITTNEARLRRLQAATAAAGGENSYYFALREHLDAVIERRPTKKDTVRAVPFARDLLGALWLTPKDVPRSLRDDLDRAFSYGSDPDITKGEVRKSERVKR